MSMNHSEFSEIPKVELVNFSFSPPGPMGWSSAEYESMLEDPETFLSKYKIRHEEPATGNVELVELPIKKRKLQAANLNVEPLNEEVQEIVQLPVQEILETAEEPAVKKGKKSKKVKKQQIAAEMPKLEVQEPPAIAEAEEMLPAARLETEQEQQREASEPSLTESLKVAGSRDKQVYSYDRLIDLFNGVNSDSNQSNINQDRTAFRFSSRKSKSGSSKRKNRIIFLE
jgi:hypothetical protein